MKRDFYILLLSLVCSIQAYAQFSVSGTVVTADDIPLIGANIFIVDDAKNKIGTTSDSEGAFNVELNAPGQYSMTVSYLGYNNYTRNLALVNNVNLDLGHHFLKSQLNYCNP